MFDRRASGMTAGGTEIGGVGAVEDHLSIGPVPVRTDALDVEAFASALGLQRGYGPVPLTFPIRWLSLPSIRGMVIRRLGLEQDAIVQQSQTFAYFEVLELDREYTFEVDARRERTPTDRAVLHGTVRDHGGNIIATLDTLLRTFRPSGARVAPPRTIQMADTGFPVIGTGQIDLTQTQRYAAASLDDNPLHSDLAAAHAAGLDGLIVHGMLAMGQIERALLRWLPEFRVDRFHGNFLRPLPVGNRLFFHGRVARGTADGKAKDLVLRVIVCTDGNQPVCISEVAADNTGRDRSAPGLA
jgi:acyl dehydratase